MDKFLKGCLISACVCIVLGILIITGVAVSGRGREVIHAVENGGIGWSENGFSVGSTIVLENKAASEFSVINGKEYKYDADGIEKLNLELEAGIFQIVEGDGDEIIIRSSDKLDVSKDNDSISVETPDRFWVFGFGEDNLQNVEITLPKGYEFHTIDLDVGAGRVTAESLLAENMDLDIGAGEVIVSNGVADTMDLDVGMGNFQYNGIVSHDLDADCGMGNVDMVFSGQYVDHNYEVDCGMGSICVGDMTYSGVVSNQTVNNDTDSDFDLDCGMGNISISFEN